MVEEFYIDFIFQLILMYIKKSFLKFSKMKNFINASVTV